MTSLQPQECENNVIFLPFQRWKGSAGALPAPHCPRQPWGGGGTTLCSCPRSFPEAEVIGVVVVSLPKAVLWHKCDPELVWLAGAQLAFICSYTLLLRTCSHDFLAYPQDLI